MPAEAKAPAQVVPTRGWTDVMTAVTPELVTGLADAPPADAPKAAQPAAAVAAPAAEKPKPAAGVVPTRGWTDVMTAVTPEFVAGLESQPADSPADSAAAASAQAAASAPATASAPAAPAAPAAAPIAARAAAAAPDEEAPAGLSGARKWILFVAIVVIVVGAFAIVLWRFL
jgi:translation initiation factor IF-2